MPRYLYTISKDSCTTGDSFYAKDDAEARTSFREVLISRTDIVAWRLINADRDEELEYYDPSMSEGGAV